MTELKNKKTVVLGASPNPARYANVAVHRLKEAGFEAIPVGIRGGEIADIPIQLDQPDVDDVHTISLYIGQRHMSTWEDYAISLQPKRIIINPGAENPEFEQKARNQGIEVVHACTLVMLSLNNF
ncbi:MAG: CoA-binding protein [Flavobacteriales bacterium]|nr:CoA-binding protein [Flavobacteriales bacterium]